MLPDFFAGLGDLSRIGLSAAFVLVAALVSRWQKADLEKDLLIATVRSFIQLILIGYALDLVFKQENFFITSSVLLVMIWVAGSTIAQRVKSVKNAHWVGFLSVAFGSVLTLSVLLLLGVFTYSPRDIVPIGGMIIGNAMSVATLVIKRLANDFDEQKLLIESKLALGSTSREASLTQFRKSIQSAMLPVIDTTKTVGLIKLPGAMTGMILAGASPIEAVQLQIIVMYMLVGATTFTGLAAAFLTYRGFFTVNHQLKI